MTAPNFIAHPMLLLRRSKADGQRPSRKPCSPLSPLLVSRLPGVTFSFPTPVLPTTPSSAVELQFNNIPEKEEKVDTSRVLVLHGMADFEEPMDAYRNLDPSPTFNGRKRRKSKKKDLEDLPEVAAALVNDLESSDDTEPKRKSLRSAVKDTDFQKRVKMEYMKRKPSTKKKRILRRSPSPPPKKTNSSMCYSCQNEYLDEKNVVNHLRKTGRSEKPALCPVCSDLFERHGLRCTACYFVPAENIVDDGQVKCERCFGGTYTCDRF